MRALAAAQEGFSALPAGYIWPLNCACQYLLGLTFPFYNFKLSEKARLKQRTLSQSRS